MIEKNEFKKIIRNALHIKGGSLKNHQIMHPAREWFVGLLAGLIMLGLGAFWSVDTYFQYKEFSHDKDNGSVSEPVYKESAVKAAQADFIERGLPLGCHIRCNNLFW